LTLITSSQSRSVNSSGSARRMMPALFTRMSRRPLQATVSLMIRSTGSMLERSAATERNAPPPCSIVSWVSSIAERATPAIRAPACARAMAMPWPIPVFAPVTMAVFPPRLNGLLNCFSPRCHPADMMEQKLPPTKRDGPRHGGERMRRRPAEGRDFIRIASARLAVARNQRGSGCQLSSGRISSLRSS
jgi:hypothetical protein